MNDSDPAAGVEAIRALLGDFGRLPVRAGAEPTFMEIAGYPHYERVCSNLLAFFLDPESPHGLGTLLLDALMEAGDTADRDQGLSDNVSVEREVHTESGNRIDLLIESDTQVVLLENKDANIGDSP